MMERNNLSSQKLAQLLFMGKKKKAGGKKKVGGRSSNKGKRDGGGEDVVGHREPLHEGFGGGPALVQVPDHLRGLTLRCSWFLIVAQVT